MLQNLPTDYNNWLIELDTIDSTNNYAMRCLQDGLTRHGWVITSEFQSAGKGQRNKQWLGSRGVNIAMSVILDISSNIDVYFLSFMVPTVVQEVLQKVLPECQVVIKWPNDIYVNNQKLAGILTENVFRGSTMKHSVVGIGINVNQVDFELNDQGKYPTSLKSLTGIETVRLPVISAIRELLLTKLFSNVNELIRHYNLVLYRKNQTCEFKDLNSGEVFMGLIQGVNEHFELELLVDGVKKNYTFGTLQMLFDR